MRRPAALIALALLCVLGTAVAQEVLEFKPVPRESVRALERRAKARRATLPTPPPEPPAAESVEEPIVPEAPAPPSQTDLLVGKTGNIMRVGSDVHVEADQVVSGDLLAIGGNVVVDGHVEGDVVAMGGNVRLNATARVDGDVACIGGELTEDPGASIGGQRVTAKGLQGLRKYRREHVEREVSAVTGRIVSHLVWLLILAGIAWGFGSLAPGRTGAALATLRREPALSLGIGALVWALFIPSVVALAIVVAILCITIIGIPLALAALFGYFLFLGLLSIWGLIVACAAVGELIFSRRAGAAAMAPELQSAGPSLSKKAVLGVLVLAGSGFVGEMFKSFGNPLHGLGTLIDVLASIATFVAGTAGAGALLRTEVLSGRLRRWWSGRGASAAAAPVAPAGSPVAPAIGGMVVASAPAGGSGASSAPMPSALPHDFTDPSAPPPQT